MSNVVIAVDGLGKRFVVNEARYRGSLMEQLGRVLRWNNPGKPMPTSAGGREPETVWALRDVSFEIRRGTVVGLIGRNGSGKSTLMKILARITLPTEGYAELRGRVGALLEVGTGFHPDLSGKDNVFLNGAILGMSRKETAQRLDEIIAFSEVSEFIDTPVKHYSTGMFMRLAFSVAAHFDAEIMLIDEVLAVGDEGFQKKCLAKIRQIVRADRTVVFVSHDMNSVRDLCAWCLLLDHGQLIRQGLPHECIETYHQMMDGSI